MDRSLRLSRVSVGDRECSGGMSLAPVADDCRAWRALQAVVRSTLRGESRNRRMAYKLLTNTDPIFLTFKRRC